MSLETINLELKKENKALHDTVAILLKQIDKIREIDRTRPIRLDLSPEQRIIEDQIMYMEAASMERPLSLDETRALDIHIKNKRLLTVKESIDADYTEVPDGLTESDLVRIAGNVKETEEARPIPRGKSKTSDKDTVE